MYVCKWISFSFFDIIIFLCFLNLFVFFVFITCFLCTFMFVCIYCLPQCTRFEQSNSNKRHHIAKDNATPSVTSSTRKQVLHNQHWNGCFEERRASNANQLQIWTTFRFILCGPSGFDKGSNVETYFFFFFLQIVWA